MGLAVAHLPRFEEVTLLNLEDLLREELVSGVDSIPAPCAAKGRINGNIQRTIAMLAGLLRGRGGIRLVEHPAICQGKIGEKDGRKENPPSGNMET
jgi:hypothetical protein